MESYDTGYRDGYAAALHAIQRIPTTKRLVGNDWVRFLDDLREEAGISIDPRLGVAVRITFPR